MAYPGHVPTNVFQKVLLAAGSAAVAITNPARGDMVAVFGEVTGPYILPYIRRRMQADTTGARILREQPRITDKTLDLVYLKSLPPMTLGSEFAKFLERLDTTPDARPLVQFVDDPKLAYVMQRYRETHDLYHIALGMKTDMLGEVIVKWFEGLQLGLPMCMLGGLFGAVRLYPKQREKYKNIYLPWILKTAADAEFLMNVYWEKHWATPLTELRTLLKIEPLSLYDAKT